MWWSLFFPAVIIVGYWVAPSKSTIITKSVKFCWTAVEWYTILEIRSSMFIDKMKVFIKKPFSPTLLILPLPAPIGASINPAKTLVSIEAESSPANSRIDTTQESVIQSVTEKQNIKLSFD